MNLYRIAINVIFATTLINILMSCSTGVLDRRIIPLYSGVDPKAAPYVNKWLELAKNNGLKFHDTVTVGFRNINQYPTLAICNYGILLREIDIDSVHWNDFTETSRKIMIWHELTHCYCDRSHDYGENKPYGNDGVKARKDPTKRDGFYLDNCPKSIMFPEILNDSCFNSHYNDYTKEMFDRCIPY